MDTIRKLLSSGRRSWSGEEAHSLYAELRAAGWVRDTSRPETIKNGPGEGRIGYPWWVNTQGQEVYGLLNVMRRALREEEERQPPSSSASRIMDALSRNPDLANEIRELLNRQTSR